MIRMLCLLALSLAAPAGAAGQTVKPPANDDCLTCHGDPSAAREDGRSVAVLPDVYGASVHGAAGANAAKAALAHDRLRRWTLRRCAS